MMHPLPLWQKQGLIYQRKDGDFFQSHTMRAVPYLKPNGVLRLFLSSRCKEDMMHPTYIDVNPDNPQDIIDIGEAPLLTIGKPGLFDDSGITVASIAGDFIYYTGWKRRRYGVTFELSIGIARICDNGDHLEKIYSGPILAQDIHHPYLVAGAYVLKTADNHYRMWYCSGTEWINPPHGPEPLYSVVEASSVDGIQWRPSSSQLSIPYNYPGEVISAPWVVKTDQQFIMYYPYRGSATREEKNYTIGVAVSPDGSQWQRLDHLVGITKSESGWDSEMICYPAIFNHKNKTYLFYSGNSVGRGGIGYAIADRYLTMG